MLVLLLGDGGIFNLSMRNNQPPRKRAVNAQNAITFPAKRPVRSPSSLTISKYGEAAKSLHRKEIVSRVKGE